MKRLLALLLTLGLFTSVALAHNGMVHVMGVVTATSDTNITVKTMHGESQTVAVTAGTKCLRGTAPAKLKEIKVGDHVVIHATKKGDQLVAAEVKVGPMKNMQRKMGSMDMNGAKR